MQHITTHYPEAQTLTSLNKAILKELENHGMSPSECIWGTSICSDEVNNSFNMLGKNFAGPGPFRFGGISGLPFTGKTGFMAYASHIPEGGGAIILYGPHIGISKNGILGEILREKQPGNSTCCGSLIAGLESVNKGMVPIINHDDYQQGQVTKMLIEQHEKIKESDEQIKTITEIAYQQIKKELTDIISASQDAFANSKILLIGGIVINTDWDQEDYFEIRNINFFD